MDVKLSVVCFLAVVVAAVVALRARTRPPRDGFYTEYAAEEPTRPYEPYCGTPPPE